MGKEWVKVVVASIFEMVWVTGLAHANNFFEWLATAIGILVSFYLLTSAVKKLPIGTVYAVFAGMGSIGSILVGAVFFGETINVLKIVFMTTLILGVIGLKLIESKNQENPEDFENLADETEHIVYANINKKAKKIAGENKGNETALTDSINPELKENEVNSTDVVKDEEVVESQFEEVTDGLVEPKQVSEGETSILETDSSSTDSNVVAGTNDLVLTDSETTDMSADQALENETEDVELDEMAALKLKIDSLVKKLDMIDIEDNSKGGN